MPNSPISDSLSSVQRKRRSAVAPAGRPARGVRARSGREDRLPAGRHYTPAVGWRRCLALPISGPELGVLLRAEHDVRVEDTVAVVGPACDERVADHGRGETELARGVRDVDDAHLLAPAPADHDRAVRAPLDRAVYLVLPRRERRAHVDVLNLRQSDVAAAAEAEDR